ncbi:MAG: hypothetical protein ACRDQ4_24825 [Pseudonocardiaceae bacterium]
MNVDGDWEQGVRHFIIYLPASVKRWVVWTERQSHEKIRNALLSELPILHSFVLGDTPASLVGEVARKYADDPDTGFIGFEMKDVHAVHRYCDYRDAFGYFSSWLPSRVKLCLDVSDRVFSTLFAEDPHAVAARCRETHHRVQKESQLTFCAPDSSAPLNFDCEGRDWIIYDGIQDWSDYGLPIGEVACLPSDVSGVLAVEGWIIGTIPFGLKYPIVRQGELSLEFMNGEVRRIMGTNTALCSDLETALERVPGLRVVGELGLGQSLAVVDAVRTTRVARRWYERHYGMHIGLGAELPETSERDQRLTSHHLDLVLSRGSLVGQTEKVLEW